MSGICQSSEPHIPSSPEIMKHFCGCILYAWEGPQSDSD